MATNGIVTSDFIFVLDNNGDEYMVQTDESGLVLTNDDGERVSAASLTFDPGTASSIEDFTGYTVRSTRD